MSYEVGIGVIKKCYVCGKVFNVVDAPHYVYKTHRNNSKQYYCSWSCLRKIKNEAKVTKDENS